MPDASSCNVTCSCQSLNCLSYSRAQLKKEVVVAAFRLCKSLDTRQRWRVPGTAGSCLTNASDKKGESQAQRAVVQHCDKRHGEKMKRASSFTLLRRITRLKCVNSKVRSIVESYSLDRDSPKGSCHLVEPTWGTRLYRKASRILDLECINRANQQQRWNPVKKWSECSVEFWNGHQQRSEMDRSSLVKHQSCDMAVLGLAACHSENGLENCRYVQVISLDILRTP